MRINLIGECDKRPVLYTLMKICQGLGDALLVTSSSRVIRLSDTRDIYGHYQNTMIATTQEGLDDFLENFVYDLVDFNFVIVDNIIDAEADLTIYVQGYTQSERELESLEYLDSYATIKLYSDKLIDSNTPYKLEEFEAMRDMCVVAPKVIPILSGILAQAMNIPVKNIISIAQKDTSISVPKQHKVVFGKGGK